MKKNGSTTVAATMYLAHLAGLKLFVTGGIGGVHRGADKTFDISADLTELARTPVTVVSAGIKSILDVGKTVEVMAAPSSPCSLSVKSLLRLSHSLVNGRLDLTLVFLILIGNGHGHQSACLDQQVFSLCDDGSSLKPVLHSHRTLILARREEEIRHGVALVRE